MRNIIIATVLAMAMVISGCAPGMFVNSYDTAQTIVGPDGRVMRAYSSTHQDIGGTVGANMAGLAAGILANAANAAIATNYGHGYRHGRILHGMTYPNYYGTTNWGYSGGYGFW